MRATAFALTVALAAARAPFALAASPPVVVNEVYYDAPGADAGYQFVELINRTDAAVALTGFRLEAGDGSGPGRWHALWTGQAGDVIAPHARFTIGEASVFPLPDRVQTVDLENGPDAVRLVAPDGATDVLGYGALTYAEYFEGRPAADVPGGSSLARLPDGVDTDDDAADFVAISPPTPGAPNRPEKDVAVSRASASERVEPGEPVRVHAVLVNRGLFGIEAPEIATHLWAAPRPADAGGIAQQDEADLAPDSLVAELDAPADLLPGDSTAVDLAFTPPSPGAWDVTVACDVLDDGIAANDRAHLAVQVGAGALALNEVCAAPSDGPEWVELANVSASSVFLADWTLEDATGRRALVAYGSWQGSLGVVAPDSLVVLTSDPAAFLALYPALPATKVFDCQPWPTLNNSAPDGKGPADRLVLRAPDGRAIDALDLPEAFTGGATLERRALAGPTGAPANWGESAIPGGTPGEANSIGGGPPRPGVGLVASRASLAAHRPALLSYRTGFERARVALRVYDLRGRPVRELLDGAVGPGQAGVAWAGDDAAGKPVEPGLYVAGLSASDANVGTASSPGPVVRARTCVVVR
jgi:hypothetical protein